MEIVLLGHMGRDEAAAERLAGHKLHVLGQWENPGLVDKAKASGGQFHVVNSIKDVGQIADITQGIQPDIFFTNFDDSLAAGVVDAIKQRVHEGRMPDLLIPCPDRQTSKIEWDKFYLRELVDKIEPSFNPINFMVNDRDAALIALDFFENENTEIALKPRNLTGGKGVRVMGKHFNTYDEGRDYILQVLADEGQEGIEIQEKLEGHEFTLQLFTDGSTLIRPPVTYDYPYREDGDEGPGTGGMGTFTMPAGEQPPFVIGDDYDTAIGLMEKLLVEMQERGHDYKGILYPTFFKTPDGLKIVEVNARGGDPELVNILDLLEDDVDFGEVLRAIALKELTPTSVRFKKMASAMIYLVSPDYGYREGPSYEFQLDTAQAKEHGCQIRFAAAEKVAGNRYHSVGSSRTVGLSALAPTPWNARAKIQAAIESCFGQPLPLEWRKDIADEKYIQNLT